ncbi:hypothetical protein ARTSIC4J27_4108 [Pseudarthrobacter siccitolerans]|uniref:Uncharacterized protein n=1 Tax=Pseudarthrobacter siccitolerans TaxID=861266 RepID=A0A024H8P8_9MICC|nr:hypothetical protein ARTSIC4J27_4108 [Pseudarthrobacter siccitolerans]
MEFGIDPAPSLRAADTCPLMFSRFRTANSLEPGVGVPGTLRLTNI